MTTLKISNEEELNNFLWDNRFKTCVSVKGIPEINGIQSIPKNQLPVNVRWFCKETKEVFHVQYEVIND